MIAPPSRLIGLCVLCGALACGGSSGKGSSGAGGGGGGIGGGGGTGGDDRVIMLGTSSRLTGVAWSGSLLLAVSDGEQVLRSSGGGAGSWRPYAPGLYIGNSTRVIWDGRRFVTVDGFGSVFTSRDGTSLEIGAFARLKGLVGIVWTGAQSVGGGVACAV